MASSPAPESTRVAVVIPAYNAEDTLADTLDSVLAQTHRNLEIVVVDDGSTDNTRKIADSYAACDPRVRVISQENGGVARARNAGIAATTAEFIAPIDADDLWHPEKTRLQLDVMRTGGQDTGFVYSPYRQIDEQGCSLGFNSSRDRFEGWVYFQHWLCNFVGNGSAMLIRRNAIEQAGGYETSLFDRGLQGAEDWMLQLLIARNWKVRVVPLYLIGYRQRRGAMSEDRRHMLRAILASTERVAELYGDAPEWLLLQRRARIEVSVFWQYLKLARYAEAARALSRALGASPATVVARFIAKLRYRVLRQLGLMRRGTTAAQYKPVPFLEMEPDEGPPGHLDRRMRRQLKLLASLDGPPDGHSATGETGAGTEGA
jgi:glycosyltransferase involved in cell wall biosynthesis